MEAGLTQSAIARMYRMSGSTDDPSFSPTIQVIHVKKIDNKNAVDDRFKLILSDGVHFFSGMCATQLNHLVHQNIISHNCILKVTEFIVNTMGSGAKICIILGCDAVPGDNPGNRIGEPVDISKVPNGAPAHPSVNNNNDVVGGRINGNVQAGNMGGGGGNPYGGQRTSPGSNPYGNKGGNRFGGRGQASGPTVRTSSAGAPITPISGLNMYSNRWTIRAKVTTKSQVRTWSNAKGEGSLFSIELLDSSGTDVKCTFFKEAVDKFYNFIEEGRTYVFSGGRLKVANMQYNSCKSQFEITFDQNSEIHLDQEGGDDIQDSYDFVKISNLENVDPSTFVDILAVVKHVGEPATIVSKKSGKEVNKCELTVKDDSGAEVRLTVWGDTALSAQTKFANYPIVAFKKARVSDYGGRTLSASGFAINPNIPDAKALQQWWAQNGNKTQTRSLSSTGGNRGPVPFDQRKTVSSVKSEHLGCNDKPDYLTFKATITFLKKLKSGDDGAWYTACANAGDPCKNMFKATQTSDGMWHCDKCQQTNEKCVRRFIFSGTVTDDTSTSWVSVFNEQAEIMFGSQNEPGLADRLYEQLIEKTTGKDLYDSTFAIATYTDWIFRCRVKQEMVGDEQRIKTSIIHLSPVDYAQESRNLLTALGV